MTTKGSYSDELSSIINQVTNREDLEDPSLAVMLSETLVEGFSLRDTAGNYCACTILRMDKYLCLRRQYLFFR